MRKPFLLRRSTWRGRFIDVWTVPHVLSGIIIAYAGIVLHRPYAEVFWIALCVGIGWELAERITRLSRTEAYTNSLSDIITAQLGFMAGWWAFARINNMFASAAITVVLCAIFGAVCLFGYRAFKYYG